MKPRSETQRTAAILRGNFSLGFGRSMLLLSKCKSGSSAGFSLVEVVLAMGLFALASVGILTLLPVILGSSRDAAAETRATQIARQVMSDLTHRGGTTGYLVLRAGDEAIETQVIPLDEQALYAVAYDQMGSPVDSESPLAQFLVGVRISPSSDRPGLSLVEVEVRPRGRSPQANPIRYISQVSAGTIASNAGTASVSGHLSNGWGSQEKMIASGWVGGASALHPLAGEAVVGSPDGIAQPQPEVVE